MCKVWTGLKCKFSGSHGGEQENESVSDVPLCSVVEADRRFKVRPASFIPLMIETRGPHDAICQKALILI
jgi:hypothetical protein